MVIGAQGISKLVILCSFSSSILYISEKVESTDVRFVPRQRECGEKKHFSKHVVRAVNTVDTKRLQSVSDQVAGFIAFNSNTSIC